MSQGLFKKYHQKGRLGNWPQLILMPFWIVLSFFAAQFMAGLLIYLLAILNVDFESKNVSGDREAAMEMVKKTHQMGVPVTQVGEQYIVGYDPDKISAALKAEGLLK